jgi:glucose-1-phosphate cytidylyltransferase
MSLNSMNVLQKKAEPWKITLIDTGETTMTGGRLKRVRDYVSDETFCFTYGDGVADIDIGALISHHKHHRRMATVTAVLPPGRYGALRLGQNCTVSGFQEKPKGDGAWINGGFFVLEPDAIDRVEGDTSMWELEPLKTLAEEGQLTAFQHTGFWQPMDTLRDRHLLEDLWANDQAPWKVW